MAAGFSVATNLLLCARGARRAVFWALLLIGGTAPAMAQDELELDTPGEKPAAAEESRASAVANPLRASVQPALPRRIVPAAAQTAPAPRKSVPESGVFRGHSADRRAAAGAERSLTYQSEEWLGSPPPGAPLATSPRGIPGTLLEDEDYFIEYESGWGGGRWRQWLPAWGKPLQHGAPNDPDRFTGRGRPLVGTSWLNRPYSASVFMGGLFGDEPFSGRVEQGGGFLGGFRVGYDFDHYAGTEFRVALSKLELFTAENVPFNRTSNIGLFDLNLLYYPWGDSRVRPYATIGLGVAAFDLFDEFGNNYNDALFLLPFGFGLKYYHGPYSVWRVDVLDNLAFGRNGLDTMHNLSISAGWEVRFGATPRLYFPVHPGVERW